MYSQVHRVTVSAGDHNRKILVADMPMRTLRISLLRLKDCQASIVRTG
jgi:hypothetical protein